MNDFEMLSIVLMILAIVVQLLIALINSQKNKNSHDLED